MYPPVNFLNEYKWTLEDYWTSTKKLDVYSVHLVGTTQVNKRSFESERISFEALLLFTPASLNKEPIFLTLMHINIYLNVAEYYLQHRTIHTPLTLIHWCHLAPGYKSSQWDLFDEQLLPGRGDPADNWEHLLRTNATWNGEG